MPRLTKSVTVHRGNDEAAIMLRLSQWAKGMGCKITPIMGYLAPSSSGRDIGYIIDGDGDDIDTFQTMLFLGIAHMDMPQRLP